MAHVNIKHGKKSSKKIIKKIKIKLKLKNKNKNIPSSPPAKNHLLQPSPSIPPTPPHLQKRKPKQKQAKNPLSRGLRSQKCLRPLNPLHHIALCNYCVFTLYWFHCKAIWHRVPLFAR